MNESELTLASILYAQEHLTILVHALIITYNRRLRTLMQLYSGHNIAPCHDEGRRAMQLTRLSVSTQEGAS